MKNINQQGSATILYTMFFIAVISLISIGFATLARRDQQAALDNNISNQAQLASETIINSVQNYIKDNKNNPANLVDDDKCNENPSQYDPYKPSFQTGGFDIVPTCITWDFSPTFVRFDVRNMSQYSFINNNFGNVTRFNLSWQKPDQSPGMRYNSDPFADPSQSIDIDDMPVLKIVTSQDLAPGGGTKVLYLMPTSYGNNNDTYSYQGQKIPVRCDTFPTVCNVVIDNMGGSRFISFEAIGSQASVSLQALNNGGTPQEIVGALALVDSNIKINQAYTKRVQAFVPLANSGWQPTGAVYSNALCKNLKLDGNTNSNGIIGPACP
jgi:hypothetical protein